MPVMPEGCPIYSLSGFLGRQFAILGWRLGHSLWSREDLQGFSISVHALERSKADLANTNGT